jgi:hypothetical protein
VDFESTKNREKGGIFSFQDLAEKLRRGIIEVSGET